MDPLDSRTSAVPGREEGPVIFDMVPIDPDQQRTAVQDAPEDFGLSLVAPTDVVEGVDPPAEAPLSEPQVQPPIGSGVSLLEAALENLPSPTRPAVFTASESIAAVVPTSEPTQPAVFTASESIAAVVPSPEPTQPAVSAASESIEAVVPAAVEAAPAVAPRVASAASAQASPAPMEQGPQPAVIPTIPDHRLATVPPVVASPSPVVPNVAPATAVVPTLDATVPVAIVAAEPAAVHLGIGTPPASASPHPSATTEPEWTVDQPHPEDNGDLAGHDELAVTNTPSTLRGLPMFPARIAGVGGTATALALSVWQAARVFDRQDRLPQLSFGALLAAVVGAFGVVLWSWLVTANARRILSPARTQELPEPGHAALAWIVPLTFIGGAAASITYLSHRFNSPTDGVTSAVPFGIALVAIIASLPMMYSPITYLSGVVRKVGGQGIRFSEWIWVSVAFAVVGVLMIVGLRAGGVFGEDFEGVAPPWVLGVVSIVPAVVIVLLGWRAAEAVETDIDQAWDRRRALAHKTTRRRGKLVTFSADGGPNHAALRGRGVVSQLPGTATMSLVVSVLLGGLALLSLVGGLIMVLFWQEAREGALLQRQADNAWDLVERLQSIDRLVTLVTVGAAALWSFMAVTNVRLASARRRNPILAAISWPLAAGGIWVIADRLVVDGTASQVVLGLVGQAAVLAVPYIFLYRASGSIGSRRRAVRISWALGVVVLVHVQGLGGLATATATVESGEIARLSSFLVIGAVLQLLAMFAAASVMRTMVDTTRQVADRHNSLMVQRDHAEASRSAPAGLAPRVGGAGVTGTPQ